MGPHSSGDWRGLDSSDTRFSSEPHGSSCRSKFLEIIPSHFLVLLFWVFSLSSRSVG